MVCFIVGIKVVVECFVFCIEYVSVIFCIDFFVYMV